MPNQNGQIITEALPETVSPDTLRVCLDYLYKVAMANNLRLSAHMIGVAAEACTAGFSLNTTMASAPTQSNHP